MGLNTWASHIFPVKKKENGYQQNGSNEPERVLRGGEKPPAIKQNKSGT